MYTISPEFENIPNEPFGDDIKDTIEYLTNHYENKISKKNIVDKVFDRMLDDEQFRVKAMQFVDVLPSLKTNKDIVEHLEQYFQDIDLPLNVISRFFINKHNKINDSISSYAIKKMLTLFSKKFIASNDTKKITKSIKKLKKQGFNYSLDLLGEVVLSEKEANEYLDTYVELIESLSQFFINESYEHLDYSSTGRLPRINLSVKVSSLYSQFSSLNRDRSVNQVVKKLKILLHKAKECNAMIFFDMEHYEYKTIILDAFKVVLLDDEFIDYPHIGLALQAYLTDTIHDIHDLISWKHQNRVTPFSIRLVRGAYHDEEIIKSKQNNWTVPVFETKEETDNSYNECLRVLFETNENINIAVATHNIESIAYASKYAKENGARSSDWEYQMLYGMADELGSVLVENNYRVRIYLPVGDIIPAMSFLVRRLLENSDSQSYLNLMKTPTTMNSKKYELSDDIFVNESFKEFHDIDEFNQLQSDIDQYIFYKEINTLYPIPQLEHYSQDWFDSVNPTYPNEVISNVICCDHEDCDNAINAANKAFVIWSTKSISYRFTALITIAQHLQINKNYYISLLIHEVGKNWEEADAEVCEAIDFLRFYSQEVLKIENYEQNVPGQTNVTRYVARGVGVILPPFNFPCAILLGQMASALVTGNTVVVKPSPHAPTIAHEIVELFDDHLPSGVVNIVYDNDGSCGEYLVSHNNTHFVNFTGSEQVGKEILKSAASQLKPVICELGGKNGMIIDSDADYDEALKTVIKSAFGYSGQKCSALSRLIVVGDYYDEFIERLVDAVISLNIDDPMLPSTNMGPVISKQAQQRIVNIIEWAATSPLASLTYYEPNDELEGYYVSPAIFKNVDPDSVLMQEEIFGPVLATCKVDTFDEAIHVLNNTRYGLTAGVFSRNPNNIEKAKLNINCGNVYINQSQTGALVGKQPFGGGWKNSGLGNKAGGVDYLKQFLLEKTVTENTVRKGCVE